MYGEKCDIEKQRAIWLQSYRPRAILSQYEDKT
jgi:hypothetical protein